MLKSPITYYRALLRYRELTKSSRECRPFHDALATNDPENDKLVVTRSFCEIDEEWILHIEQALPFVGKAIAQDRQFIRSNGEVLPIERVKHISKESVEHLSRHSDLITRRTTGDTLIPDKLYTVERLNDYAVYENRFLYTLLTHLRDFIEFRYNEILEISNSYNARIDIQKSFSIANQSIEYTLTMQDTRKNDPYLAANSECNHIVKRIRKIRVDVANLLSTQLMQEMAKAPRLKPPITKTNVLRMNNDFVRSLELYDYLLSYTEKGYTVRSGVKLFSPFPRILSDEMAEAGCLVAALGYRYGLEITDEIKNAIAAEDREERLRKAAAALARLTSLKKRLSEQEITLEEYLVSLEEELKSAQAALTEAIALRDRAEELAARLTEEGIKKDELIASLKISVAELEKTVADLKEAHAREIERLVNEHREEMDRLRAEHEAEVQAMKEEHEAEVEAIHAEHEAEVEAIHAEHEAEVQAMQEAHENEVQSIKDEYDAEIQALKQAHEDAVRALTEEHDRILTADFFFVSYLGN